MRASDLPLLAALYVGFIGRIILKDFRDLRGDALFGKRTFLVRHGRAWTCHVSATCWAAGAGLLLWARPGGSPAYVLATLAGTALAMTLLHELAGPRARHRQQDWLISALAIVGRGLVLVLRRPGGTRGAGPALTSAVIAALAVSVGGQALRCGVTGPAAVAPGCGAPLGLSRRLSPGACPRWPVVARRPGAGPAADRLCADGEHARSGTSAADAGVRVSVSNQSASATSLNGDMVSSTEIVAENGPQGGLDDHIYNRLLKERIIFQLGRPRRERERHLRAGSAARRRGPRQGHLALHQPRAAATAGMAIYDTMKWVPNDVATVAMGLTASMGQFLLSAGTKGKRYATPHARVMMHQPSGGIGGTATDIKIEAEQMLYIKKQTS